MNLVRRFTADPYLTTFGKLIKKDVTEDKILKYLISTGNTNLNYEIASPDHSVSIAFILGVDDDERAIPVWSHPMVVVKPRGEIVIVTDMRKYVTTLTAQPLSLIDVLKDKGAGEHLILRTLLTADLIAGNYGRLNNITKSITTAFALVIGNIINNLVMLNPQEQINVELAAAYYMSALTINSDDVEISDMILDRLSNMKLSAMLPRKIIAEVISKFEINPTNGLESLMNNIKSVLDETKAKNISMDSIIVPLGNIWFGPGENSTLQVSLENIPAWTSIVYSGLTNMTYKRSRLSTMLDKYKNKIEDDKFVKSISEYLRDNTLKN